MASATTSDVYTALAAALCGAAIVGGITLANRSGDMRVSMLLAAVPVALVSDLFAPREATCFSTLFVLSCCMLLAFSVIHWMLLQRLQQSRLVLPLLAALSPLVALPVWVFAGAFFDARCNAAKPSGL